MRAIFRFVPAGSVVLGLTTFGSYLLGFLRDRLLAQTFGASRLLDTYNAAFLIPDFIFNVLVASGIAAAFVPIYADLLKIDRVRAVAYARTVLNAAAGTMCVTAIILMIFANPVSALVAPGFNAHERALVAQLLRILAVSPIFFAASNALGAILITKQRFLAYGLSPMLYNIGIIGGTILLAPGLGIMGVALGTLVGALLHLFVRTIGVKKIGFVYRWQIHLRSAEFRKTLRLMLPKMLGHPVELATFWGFTAIASTLTAGSVAVLNFARNFQSVPVSLIGIAVSTASFPILAQAAVDGAAGRFRSVLKTSFWIIFIASTGAALFTLLVRNPLVGILFGGKAFDTDAIAKTAITLGVFTLSIPTEALSHLLARAFYATKNTTVPVALSIISLIVAVGGGWLLAPSLDLLALPLAFFLGSAIKLLSLMILLPARLRRLRDR